MVDMIETAVEGYPDVRIVGMRNFEPGYLAELMPKWGVSQILSVGNEEEVGWSFVAPRPNSEYGGQPYFAVVHKLRRVELFYSDNNESLRLDKVESMTIDSKRRAVTFHSPEGSYEVLESGSLHRLRLNGQPQREVAFDLT